MDKWTAKNWVGDIFWFYNTKDTVDTNLREKGKQFWKSSLSSLIVDFEAFSSLSRLIFLHSVSLIRKIFLLLWACGDKTIHSSMIFECNNKCLVQEFLFCFSVFLFFGSTSVLCLPCGIQQWNQQICDRVWTFRALPNEEVLCATVTSGCGGMGKEKKICFGFNWNHSSQLKWEPF